MEIFKSTLSFLIREKCVFFGIFFPYFTFPPKPFKNSFYILAGWCFAIFITPPAHSQFNINGSVRDELGNHIPHSNVLLLKIKDSSLVKGVISDPEGKFLLEEILSGNYLLAGSMLGQI